MATKASTRRRTSSTKKSTKKSTTTKAAPKKGTSKKKVDTRPKSKPMPNGESVHAHLPQREPRWNPRRIAVVKAMRALKATSPNAARTAGEIGKKAGKVDGIDLGSKEGVKKVKIILDVYRTSELLHNGFAASIRHEGERELKYYLLDKGKKTNFPQKSK